MMALLLVGIDDNNEEYDNEEENFRERGRCPSHECLFLGIYKFVISFKVSLLKK